MTQNMHANIFAQHAETKNIFYMLLKIKNKNMTSSFIVVLTRKENKRISCNCREKDEKE